METENTCSVFGAGQVFFSAGYPAPGYRDYDSGALYLIGFGGFSWNSTVATDSTHARYLGFGNNEPNPQGSNHRAFGFQVRCLQE